MPYFKHSLDAEWERAQRERFAPTLAAFNRVASEITSGRKAKGKPVRVPLVFRRDEFISTVQDKSRPMAAPVTAWKHMLGTLEKRDKILSATAYLEPISSRQPDVKGLYNVVVDVTVDA
jgi:hypothetical protein